MIFRRLSGTSADSTAGLEVPPVGSPSTDGITRLPVDGSTEKIGKASEYFQLGPTVHRLPIGDEDDRPTTPIILRSSPENYIFRLKTHRIGVGALCDIGIMAQSWHTEQLDSCRY